MSGIADVSAERRNLILVASSRKLALSASWRDSNPKKVATIAAKDPSPNNCFDKPARMLQAGSIAGIYGGPYAGWDRCPGAAGGRGRGGASHGPPRPSPSARAICVHLCAFVVE